MSSTDQDIYEIAFQQYGSSTNNTHTFKLPINNDKYHYHVINVSINNPRLTWRLYDDKNNELKGLHFNNGELSSSTSIKIVVEGEENLFQCNIVVCGYAKQLSEPVIHAQSFHLARIKPKNTYHAKFIFKLRYRLQGTESWIDSEDSDLKISFVDEIYEAQLYHEIIPLGVTIESPIIVVKDHWKHMSDFLRINMEELAVLNQFSANFGERYVGDGIFSATVESVGNNRTLLQLNSFASTLFYSKSQLRSGERYLFKFTVTSLSQPLSKDYASVSREFTVPKHSEVSPAEGEEWISKFGKEPLKFSSAGKISRWDRIDEYKLQLHPSGWFILEITLSGKHPKRLAGTFHQVAIGSDGISLSLYPLIKDKYIQREVLVIEGDESGAPTALVLAEIVNEIMKHLEHSNDYRLVCKYWYQSLPLQITAEVGANDCNLRFLGQRKFLFKI